LAVLNATSELCNSSCAEFCAALANVHRTNSGTFFQFLFSNIAVCSVLTAAAASAKHFRVKEMK